MKNESKILKRWIVDGIECVVVNIRNSHFCAYVGVSASHPISGIFYDSVPLSCHGGLTFGGTFEENFPELGGFYFYGWDYAHAGDFVESISSPTDKKWELSEVVKETESVAYEFKRLVEFAEKIKNK